MRKVVSLATYLESYSISREKFDEEIEKDKDFYSKYIEWGSKKDGSDTILPPKVLERLGEAFNDYPSSEMTITVDGEVQDSVNIAEEDTPKAEDTPEPVEETIEKPKRKRRTKAEMEAARETEGKEEQINMSEFMDVPTEELKEEKEVPVKATEGTKRKKKSKMGITKQYINENGKVDPTDADSLKQLRKFLMNDGVHKLEDVALMTDEEVKDTFGKDYFVINTEEKTYIIRITALMAIMGDVFVVGRK